VTRALWLLPEPRSHFARHFVETSGQERGRPWAEPGPADRRVAHGLRAAIDELLSLGVLYLVDDADGRRFELAQRPGAASPGRPDSQV
jgi:hypothetical protein